MKINFRRIKVKTAIDGEIKEFDVAKTVGNAIYCNTPDLGELEFAQRIYKEGEVEVDEQGANIIRNYVDPAPILAVVKTAIYNELEVLVVDADPQANASSGLGVDIRSVEQSIYECVVNGDDPKGAITNTEVEGLDIIPSHIDLVGAEIEMLNMENREQILKQILVPLKERYDYILIDCSPSLGLITVNALTAADSVMIPVQCEYFALEGISKLLNTIKIIKSKLNPALEIEGFLLTMYDSRLRLANQIYEEVKRPFRDLVFTTVIQRNVKLSEASSYGKPVLLYDAESKGALNHMQLAQELIDKNK